MKNIKEIVRTTFESVDVHDSVASALGACKESHANTVLVFDGDVFKGLFSPEMISKKRFDATEFQVGQSTQPVKIVSSETSVEELSLLFAKTSCLLLPIGDEKVEGIVLATDVIFASGKTLPQGTTQSVDAKTRVDSFLDKKIPFAFVTKDEETLGVVSYQDVAKRVLSSLQDTRRGHKSKIETKGFTSEKKSIFELTINNFLLELPELASSASYDEIAKELTKFQAVILNSSIVSTLDFMMRVEKEEPTIDFVGVPTHFKSGLEHEWKKVVRKYGAKINEPIGLKVHLKEHHKEGNQSKTSVALHMNIAQTLVNSSATNWDTQVAAKDAFAGLEAELEKKYRQ